LLLVDDLAVRYLVARLLDFGAPGSEVAPRVLRIRRGGYDVEPIRNLLGVIRGRTSPGDPPNVPGWDCRGWTNPIEGRHLVQLVEDAGRLGTLGDSGFEPLNLAPPRGARGDGP